MRCCNRLMDYRGWEQDAVNYFGLFTRYGKVLYVYQCHNCLRVVKRPK